MLEFDASYQKIDEACFDVNIKQSMRLVLLSTTGTSYPDTAKVVPTNIPRPTGKYIIITVYCCDADHARCRVARRSRTCFIVLQKAKYG
jgi:hypothetical protein